ncbi:endonuclease V [Blastococcus capsensis]|uniref:endonuclease V n=1 Tax=Blastococcus capsensis TaxID=1564163 RepID=UPI002540176E|nr:endonuclease V [Blastococcus capsensis]MDK3256951.1 endonuclease V [Blastococcus capsensis]
MPPDAATPAVADHGEMSRTAGGWWPADAEELQDLQRRLGLLRPPPWHPGTSPHDLAAAAVVHDPDEGGRAWAGAVLVRGRRMLAAQAVAGAVHGPYLPTLRSARDGPLLVTALEALGRRPDVVLLAAAGRDHPRHAGLALHLGAVLGLPSIGLTDRPLSATGPVPGPVRGDTAALVLDGVEVARRVRTATGVRPVVAHAAWRTTGEVAAALLLAGTRGARTPWPLREARRLAREARGRG